MQLGHYNISTTFTSERLIISNNPKPFESNNLTKTHFKRNCNYNERSFNQVRYPTENCAFDYIPSGTENLTGIQNTSNTLPPLSQTENYAFDYIPSGTENSIGIQNISNTLPPLNQEDKISRKLTLPPINDIVSLNINPYNCLFEKEHCDENLHVEAGLISKNYSQNSDCLELNSFKHINTDIHPHEICRYSSTNEPSESHVNQGKINSDNTHLARLSPKKIHNSRRFQDYTFNNTRGNQSREYYINLVLDFTSTDLPKQTYSALIAHAILNSESEKMTLNQLYEWFQDSFPIYRSLKKNWKHSIRHNLSINIIFEKVPRDATDLGKDNYWKCIQELDRRCGRTN